MLLDEDFKNISLEDSNSDMEDISMDDRPKVLIVTNIPAQAFETGELQVCKFFFYILWL